MHRPTKTTKELIATAYIIVLSTAKGIKLEPRAIAVKGEAG